MRKRYLLAVASVIVVVLATAGIVYALSGRHVQNTVVITQGNIQVYSDEACTTVVESIDWGSLSAGDTVPRVVYVKNESTETVTVTVDPVVLDALMCTGPSVGFELAPGAVEGVQLILATNPEATPATYNWTLNFNAS